MHQARRLRVVYLDHCAKLSGGEIALARLLEALGDSVEPVVILAEDGPLVGSLKRLGVRVAVFPLPHSVARVTRNHLGRHTDPMAVARAALYSARLVPVLRDIQPQIVHTNSLKSALYGAPAARLAGLPAVWHLRDHISSDYMSRTAMHVVRAATRILPTVVVANSRSTLATVPGARGGLVVHNAVSLPEGLAHRRSARGPLRIVVLGRLAHWKAQDVFLDAFAAAFPEGGAVARIVGSAMFGEESYAQGLRTQAVRLGISDRVEFRGFREDVEAELAASDVLVHCSRTAEPFGQVVVEGLAAGLAVIATDAGGPAEILTSGQDGLLVPPGDAGALKGAMLRLTDPELRARLAAAGRITAARYSPERAAEAMLAVYGSLIPRRPS